MPRVDRESIDRAVQEARSEALDKDVTKLLGWAWELLGEELMMSTAFGKSGMVILHHLRNAAPEVPVYFVDTGYHFPETLEFFERIRSEWGLRLVAKRPALFGPRFEAKYGERAWERDPDFCCHKNKVEPFRELFGESGKYQGWITGVRRDQSSTRAQARPLERLEGNLVKVQPLALWTRADVEQYIDRNDIPLHPLFAKGYPSIGCLPCTSPGDGSSDERIGRWAGRAKTECGLHTFWKKAAEREAVSAAENEVELEATEANAKGDAEPAEPAEPEPPDAPAGRSRVAKPGPPRDGARRNDDRSRSRKSPC